MPNATSFANNLSSLYELVHSDQTTFLDCVRAVVDCLCEATGCDRVIFSEIRRQPQSSELVYVAYGPLCPETLRISEAPAVNMAVMDAVERIGVLEVALHRSLPEGLPTILYQAKAFVDQFMRANGVIMGAYAPRSLSPNCSALLTLHRCREDKPFDEAELEGLKLAQIVLGEITQRKRWRFNIPGRTPEHDRLLPFLAEGCSHERMAQEFGWPIEKVETLCSHILLELCAQYGLRNEQAAMTFLAAEMLKSI